MVIALFYTLNIMSILSIVSKTGGKKTKNICNVSSIIHNQGNCGPYIEIETV
jgi:hypothetical protein